MTQWELTISLVLFAVINLSQEHCNDYFTKEKVKEWGKELELQIPLIKMDNLQDTMLCSANETCSQNSDSTSCILAELCRPTDGQMPVRCDGENLGTVPFYLFMCLMEKALPYIEVHEHCKYVAEYSLTHVIVFDQTPTTATLSKTTAEPTKCAETPPTPTTAAALPTKPPAVLQSSEVTETSTQVAEIPPSEAKSVQVMTTGNITLVVFLLVFLLLIAFLAAVKLVQMRQKWRKNCTEVYVLNEIPSEAESLSPTHTASPQDQIV